MSTAVAAGGSNTFAPTLNTKHEFDANNYVKIPNVCIFDEHDGAEEGLPINFDEPMLQKIIDRCNERISETGDHPPVVDGHEDEENPNPPVLGFAQNFQMGEIGKKKKRKAIFCDMLIHKDKYERAKALPRRSIELWHRDLVADNIVLQERSPIDQISFLGATRPARDLGILTFSKEKTREKYRYYHKEKYQMDPQALKEVLEAVMQLPVLRWLEEQKKLIDEQSAQQPAEAPAQESAETAEAPLPEEEEKKEFEEPCDEAPQDTELGESKVKMAYDQAKRRYAKLESEHKALYAKVAQIERRERIAQRTNELMQLEAEGYVFSMADEVETVADLEPAKFSKHLSLIKKNYKRAPIGGLPNFVKPVVPQGEENLSPREVMLRAQAKAAELYKEKK